MLLNQRSCFLPFFSRDNQKCPWHTSSEILSRALLAFHGHIIENCHGQAQKFHGHFFQKSHGQVGNFTVNSKKSCHGQFKVCHGHFCSLTSKILIYSYHNKGDIWTLASREYYYFQSKNKHIIKLQFAKQKSLVLQIVLRNSRVLLWN